MIYQVTVNNARLDIPTDPERCPADLQSLIASCWDDQPHQRPSAEDMQACMEGILHGLKRDSRKSSN